MDELFCGEVHVGLWRDDSGVDGGENGGNAVGAVGAGWEADVECSVRFLGYNPHDVQGNNLNMGYFSLHTNNPYSEHCDC